MEHKKWYNDALTSLKEYFQTEDFEIDYMYYDGILIEYIGDDSEIHDYIVFKDYESAKESAIQSETELFEDVFDVDHVKKYIDVDKCYTLSKRYIHIMAEDIISSMPEYNIFDIINELKKDPFKALGNYSELYIWHNEEHSVFNVNYKKCAELSIDKYGLPQVLDNYYGEREYKLVGGFYAYPRG